MNSREIRQGFLDFFEQRGHRVVPSSPLVLPGDPTLLFANAGMNQFKDVFVGRDERSYVRAASSQKCLRVAGKHNDLEMVGRTPRHHTFFEMLGNFSFGDYFKDEAIRLAWELITDVYGLARERLWVSVFEGSDAGPADEEAERIWRDEIGVDAERILRLGERENFWRMGDTGPCGPCSEIHYDLGPELTSVDGEPTPENDDARYLEIWNLVFMEFDQQADGNLQRLPKPSIDTGMGLERIASVVQGHTSNYDTDLFAPIIAAIGERAGKRYGTNRDDDDSMRIIADHVRALNFLVADGIVPANDNRGYVLRRLLRRAIRHGRKLGIDEPFLHELTPVVQEQFAGVYPELAAANAAILEVGRLEEERFADTLATGLSMLEAQLADAASSPTRTLPGDEVFRLYDTFGFPLDLARDIAEERGIEIDEARFEAEMAKQRARARASWKGGKRKAGSPLHQELAKRHDVAFEGYDRLRVDGAEVLALSRDGEPVDVLREGEEGEIVLSATPFYAEAGGQVGDTGWLGAGDSVAEVLDTQRPAGRLVVHRARLRNGEIAVGDAVHAEVDAPRREAIKRNHTATHLLHAALRDVIGTHVKQAGSLVADDRLRFDFSHFSGLTERALQDIEDQINEQVLADTPIESEVTDLDDALAAGAMALFGEKYGDRVRVVTIGDYSKELCGGTHCARTGEIGLIKLTGERGIASGTRRVEAVSGDVSLSRFRELHQTVRALESILSTQRADLAQELKKRIEAAKALERELERMRVAGVREQVRDAVDSAQDVAGVKVMTRRLDGVGPKELRELADELRRNLGSGVVVLGRADESKASLLVTVTEDLRKRIPAGELVKTLAKEIGGGGGGRSDLAEAGGRKPAGLDAALALAPKEVERRLE